MYKQVVHILVRSPGQTFRVFTESSGGAAADYGTVMREFVRRLPVHVIKVLVELWSHQNSAPLPEHLVKLTVLLKAVVTQKMNPPHIMHEEVDLM